VVFVLSNAVMLLYSLYPRRSVSRNGAVANDMLLLWQTWRQAKAESEQAPAHWYFLASEESHRRGRHEEAAKWLEEGLRLFPGDYELEWTQGHILMCRGEYAAARKAWVLLLGRYGGYARFEVVRYPFFNSIAYVDALSGVSELLAEAEVCSRLALERYPWNVYCLCTRGSVLVEMGQYTEGLQLLHRALKRHTERPGRALNACYIGIAERRRGNLDESRSYFAMARRLDPNCWLLAREKEG
jgi:tetratricopeptide (TPR) repeat protein